MTPPTIRAADLVGAWELVYWQITYPNGRSTHPYGADATGLLIYSADGRMSAAIAAQPRPPFDVPDARQASDAQRARAFSSYFSYAGRYELVAGEVRHHVEFALNPGFVGSVQRRAIAFAGPDLVLSASEPTPDGPRQHELRWRCVDAAGA